MQRTGNRSVRFDHLEGTVPATAHACRILRGSCPILHNAASSKEEERVHRSINQEPFTVLRSLARAIDRYTADRLRRDDVYFETASNELTFMRAEAPTGPLHSVHGVSICITAQGRKEVALGDRVYSFASGNYFVVGVSAPTVGRIVEATVTEPYLGLYHALDIPLLLEVTRESGARAGGSARAACPFVGRPGPRALAAATRMVQLLDTPAALPVLLPAVKRELYYWLLAGPGGELIARVAMPHDAAHRIAVAIDSMKARFPAPISVPELAREAYMSASSFHAHFKRLTGLPPLQYYKRLRLLEARRLLSTGTSVTETAFAVGYESGSQFSRDFSRTFGVPPSRHDLARPDGRGEHPEGRRSAAPIQPSPHVTAEGATG